MIGPNHAAKHRQRGDNKQQNDGNLAHPRAISPTGRAAQLLVDRNFMVLRAQIGAKLQAPCRADKAMLTPGASEQIGFPNLAEQGQMVGIGPALSLPQAPDPRQILIRAGAGLEVLQRPGAKILGPCP